MRHPFVAGACDQRADRAACTVNKTCTLRRGFGGGFSLAVHGLTALWFDYDNGARNLRYAEATWPAAPAGPFSFWQARGRGLCFRHLGGDVRQSWRSFRQGRHQPPCRHLARQWSRCSGKGQLKFAAWPNHCVLSSLRRETLDWYFELGDLVAERSVVGNKDGNCIHRLRRVLYPRFMRQVASRIVLTARRRHKLIRSMGSASRRHTPTRARKT